MFPHSLVTWLLQLARNWIIGDLMAYILASLFEKTRNSEPFPVVDGRFSWGSTFITVMMVSDITDATITVTTTSLKIIIVPQQITTNLLPQMACMVLPFSWPVTNPSWRFWRIYGSKKIQKDYINFNGIEISHFVWCFLPTYIALHKVKHSRRSKYWIRAAEMLVWILAALRH